MADQLHEGGAQGVIAAELGLQPCRIRLQRLLRGWAARTLLVLLGHRSCRDLGGLHGVRDALTVKGVDHAAGVTDQQQPSTIVWLAVEAHGERRSAYWGDHVLTPETPIFRCVLQPAAE